METLKIMQVNPFFYPFRGGIENYMLDLSKYLVKRGHEVSVLCAKLPGQNLRENIEGIDVYRLKSYCMMHLPALFPPPYVIPYNSFFGSYKIAKKLNPDLFHLHNRYFYGFYPIFPIKRMMHKPLFLTIHNSKPIKAKKERINWRTTLLARLFDNLIGNMVMRRCNFIFGNSQYSLDVTIPKDYPKERTSLAYNGLYTDIWKKTNTDIKQKFGHDYLLMTDVRLVPQKGLQYLLKAMTKIEQDCLLLVKGRGPKEHKYVKLAKKLGVEKKVKFVTQILPEKDMIDLYSAADMFVLPSVHEPFGIVLIQAMATETPIVATNVGGVSEVIQNTGLMAESKNPDMIAAKISSLIEDPALRKKLAKQARKRVVETFDWKVVGRQVEDTYKKYLESH